MTPEDRQAACNHFWFVETPEVLRRMHEDGERMRAGLQTEFNKIIRETR